MHELKLKLLVLCSPTASWYDLSTKKMTTCGFAIYPALLNSWFSEIYLITKNTAPKRGWQNPCFKLMLDNNLDIKELFYRQRQKV